MKQQQRYIAEDDVLGTLWLHIDGQDIFYPQGAVTAKHYSLAASLHIERLGIHGSYFISYLPTLRVIARHTVGSDGKYTVYWMIDEELRVRNGMMVQYDGNVRIRNFLRYRTKGTGYSTCLFGANQLHVRPCFAEVAWEETPVGLTDSPEEAIRRSRLNPELAWLSTCWMYPTERLLTPLYGRDVVLLFSDSDMMRRAGSILRSIRCSTIEIEQEYDR